MLDFSLALACVGTGTAAHDANTCGKSSPKYRLALRQDSDLDGLERILPVEGIATIKKSKASSDEALWAANPVFQGMTVKQVIEWFRGANRDALTGKFLARED